MPELEDLLAFEAWWQTNTTLSKTTFTLIVIVYPH
jgi:P2-related tail formation protein